MLPFDFHSPVEPLDFPLFKEKGITVHMKRDDRIHPFISGNKWRKLKYVLQTAYDQGKKHLVTFGGPWSNHLLAAACAGAKFGFKTTAFVRGEPVSNPNLSLCNIFGMELQFVTRAAYKDKHELFRQYYGQDDQAYFIDEGGYSLEGAQGCAEILDGLSQTYDHIFCACGTGTTLAGLSMAKTLHGSHTQLHGVPVLAGGTFIKEAVAKLYNAQQANAIILHTAYHFGGYAKTTPVLNTFIKMFARQTGILIEPVYTGKLCYAVFDLAACNYFQPGQSILLIHTGGLTGILGMHEQFDTPET
ncbi:1-aminocyclopropane-1-carboxylate deaminase/D-cysteine desulfhydrase [Parapedobacter koreensis]|uniref:1-aminocyclopropane-1-carboxylate deaminase n=1 Tax=Parapedobacter koreensis TaxID=332977 RepID=A0A1H7MKY3_9SPHI|nr:pyridoxal-phosphate dependent enzyme [Parapedobacter koreensis]SEL11960.1 1-aminocyclopropane-1-carboxylate deaminase [Parapedobacter koreensis]